MTRRIRGKKPNVTIPCPEVSYLLCFMCFILLNEYCITVFILLLLLFEIRDLSDGSFFFFSF